jgi:hypothetical protein
MESTHGRIIHTFDQVAQGDVYVSYQPAGPFTFPGWYVIGKDFKTAPDAPWEDHGSKGFTLEGDGRGWRSDPALSKALAWACQHYGIINWQKNGLGDYIDADKVHPDLEMDVEAERNARESMERRKRTRRERRQKGVEGGPG